MPRGSERFGLVASSKAQRLKPHAIDIRVNIDPVHWFLNDKEDTRSSYYLEDAATEFQVQGLELDWTCVTWDGDLRFTRLRLELSRLPRRPMDRTFRNRKIELSPQCLPCFAHSRATRNGYFCSFWRSLPTQRVLLPTTIQLSIISTTRHSCAQVKMLCHFNAGTATAC